MYHHYENLLHDSITLSSDPVLEKINLLRTMRFPLKNYIKNQPCIVRVWYNVIIRKSNRQLSLFWGHLKSSQNRSLWLPISEIISKYSPVVWKTCWNKQLFLLHIKKNAFWCEYRIYFHIRLLISYLFEIKSKLKFCFIVSIDV